MDQELKTYQQWLRKGLAVQKGQAASYYLVNDERSEARGLFSREQTGPISPKPDKSEAETWTIVLSADEWEEIKAERAQRRRDPRVKIRRPEAGGVEVWCGPDRDIIALLKANGYHYLPAARYWFHPDKDAEQVASAFEKGKIRDRHVRVNRAWTVNEAPIV